MGGHQGEFWHMGGTALISEKQFAALYTSFWASVLPLSEAALRAMNLRVNRVYEPLETACPAVLNGFVNELAFRLTEASNGTAGDAVPSNVTPEVYSSTEAYIMRLPRPAVPSSPCERDTATSDALAIAQRLTEMIGRARGTRSVSFRPPFLGCGMLDACEGDVLIGEDLWEVKSGDRHFRQTDIRQLLIYCALNHAARSRQIDCFSLVNPRAGVVADGTISDLTHDVAGCDPGTLFDEIIACVTMGEGSM